ncbi:hypothetical protein LTR37_001055 [Vermiconidia calcicola]|uniref:Uncharacterized protein n=1 Tax=Vermiconidia calcicola TaxID=1690605 RepID=A0ACC3NWZ4_9PEZI|nr:hypothetical protein LTR37_001055 [Vermiconidia calcicola]
MALVKSWITSIKRKMASVGGIFTRTKSAVASKTVKSVFSNFRVSRRDFGTQTTSKDLRAAIHDVAAVGTEIGGRGTLLFTEGIPIEIRALIFGSALQADSTLWKSRPKLHAYEDQSSRFRYKQERPRLMGLRFDVSLLCLNRQLHGEALDAFFKINDFRFCSYREYCAIIYGDHQWSGARERIRSTELFDDGQHVDWQGHGVLPRVIDECLRLPQIKCLTIDYDAFYFQRPC